MFLGLRHIYHPDLGLELVLRRGKWPRAKVLCLPEQRRRGSMYLEEETDKKSEMISCIFSLKEEVGALAKALRLFEVTPFSPHTAVVHNVTPSPPYSQFSHEMFELSDGIRRISASVCQTPH